MSPMAFILLFSVTISKSRSTPRPSFASYMEEMISPSMVSRVSPFQGKCQQSLLPIPIWQGSPLLRLKASKKREIVFQIEGHPPFGSFICLPDFHNHLPIDNGPFATETLAGCIGGNPEEGIDLLQRGNRSSSHSSALQRCHRVGESEDF